jgi:hypothetical protein
VRCPINGVAAERRRNYVQDNGVQIYILPWLQIREPVHIMGYVLLPREQAINEAGEFSSHVSEATSYFFESHRLESLVDGEAPQLDRVAPTVVLLEDDADIGRVAIAMDGLFFATMVANTPDRYANSANFIQFAQSVGRAEPGDMGRRFRTLFGSRVLGTRARHSLETRPPWAGEYRGHNAETLRLFESVADLPEAEPVRECIRWLHSAMTDSDTMRRDAEHSFYALSLERLLHRNGQTRNTRIAVQQQLAYELLGDALNGVSRMRESAATSTEFTFRSGIVEAARWVRDERNSVWHPDSRRTPSPLDDQLAIRPNVVAFRVVSALALASMARLAPKGVTSQIISYIAASEHWIEEISDLTRTEAHQALNRFNALWSAYAMRMRPST